MKKLTLTKEDRNLTVKKLRAKGFTQRVISNRLGISSGTVSNILSNYAYNKKNKFTSLTSRNAYIRKLSKSGRRNKDIARITGLDPSTVSVIISGKRRSQLRKTKSTTKFMLICRDTHQTPKHFGKSMNNLYEEARKFGF